MGWLFAAAVIALLVCILVLRRLRRERDQQHRMMERLRTSHMYAGLGRMLHQLPAQYIERVDIACQGVTVLLLNGKQVRYLFEEHNSDPVRPDTVTILAQAVATDLPAVQDRDYFKLRRIDDVTPGGVTVSSYAYILSPHRKDYLLRAMKEKGRL